MAGVREAGLKLLCGRGPTWVDLNQVLTTDAHSTQSLNP